jgi:hypothetical protein
VTPPAATARRSNAAPVRSHPAPSRRSPLRVVEPTPRRRAVRRHDRHRAAAVVSAGLLAASLGAVVVGHSMLAAGQVRLANIDAALTTAQNAERQDMLRVAVTETPSRVASEAVGQDHLVAPAQVDQLPSVPLDVALPVPSVAPAPPPAAHAATAATPSAQSAATAGTPPTTPAATTTTQARGASASTATPAATPGVSAGQ